MVHVSLERWSLGIWVRISSVKWETWGYLRPFDGLPVLDVHIQQAQRISVTQTLECLLQSYCSKLWFMLAVYSGTGAAYQSSNQNSDPLTLLRFCTLDGIVSIFEKLFHSRDVIIFYLNTFKYVKFYPSSLTWISG